MAGLKELISRSEPTIKSTLCALALAGLIWAAIALFLPFKTSFISGTLDSGDEYTTLIQSYSYNSVGGLILLLAALINASAAINLLRGAYSRKRSFLWAIYSLILLGTMGFVGNTPIMSWFKGLPPEVQHSIGTPYATLTESYLKSVPTMVGLGFTVTYIVLMAFYYVLTSSRRATTPADW